MPMTLAEAQAHDRAAGEQYCDVCGCTESHACYRQCFFVADGLCSNCGSAWPHSLHRHLLAQALAP